MQVNPDELKFFATPARPCNYIADRQSISVFADPSRDLSPSVQACLNANGFRRSGRYMYRPMCPDCVSCVPVRVPVAAFRARRNQRRCWHRNQDLRIAIEPAGFTQERFALYERYQGGRHEGGGMDEPTPEQFSDFLYSGWSDTWFVDMRIDGELACVAVVDRTPSALSAVYSFFNPDLASRSLGTYAVLWQIAHANQLGLEFVYLGYWIAESRKMSYKNQFRPQEQFVDGQWRRSL